MVAFIDDKNNDDQKTSAVYYIGFIIGAAAVIIMAAAALAGFSWLFSYTYNYAFSSFGAPFIDWKQCLAGFTFVWICRFFYNFLFKK